MLIQLLQRCPTMQLIKSKLEIQDWTLVHILLNPVLFEASRAGTFSPLNCETGWEIPCKCDQFSARVEKWTCTWCCETYACIIRCSNDVRHSSIPVSNGLRKSVSFFKIILCADQIETSTSPPPRANPGHLTIFCARGVGNLTDKAFPGVGNLTLPGWGGENWTGSVRFPIFFSGAEVANSYKHVFGRDGRVWRKRWGRDIAFVSDWLTKKGLQKWECLNINDFCRLYIKDVYFLYNESRCGSVPRLCLQRFLE